MRVKSRGFTSLTRKCQLRKAWYPMYMWVTPIWGNIGSSDGECAAKRVLCCSPRALFQGDRRLSELLLPANGSLSPPVPQPERDVVAGVGQPARGVAPHEPPPVLSITGQHKP